MRKMHHTMCQGLLCMRLHSCRPVGVHVLGLIGVCVSVGCGYGLGSRPYMNQLSRVMVRSSTELCKYEAVAGLQNWTCAGF